MRIAEDRELEILLEKQGLSGAFVLVDVEADTWIVSNQERAEERRFPASTFKIANSLIALETGVVADADEIIPHGGAPQPIEAWERDMSMRDAIRISNVPVYQELARRIGRARYARWLDELAYGNRQIGDNVERFWLDGPLAISAMEQVVFLARLATGALPVAPENQQTVRDLLFLEAGDQGRLYGKTGWSTAANWLVGRLDRTRRPDLCLRADHRHGLAHRRGQTRGPGQGHAAGSANLLKVSALRNQSVRPASGIQLRSSRTRLPAAAKPTSLRFQLLRRTGLTFTNLPTSRFNMNTRTALLDVAEHAARSRGFDAFSYADLSAAVGIRKASIHHHFPAKADLALALIERYRDTFRATLASIDAASETAGARLSGFLDTYRDALDGGDTVCLCVAYSSARDSFQAPVIDELAAFHADCLAWLETIFLQARHDVSIDNPGPADAEARACLALVEGAQLMARATEDPNRYDSATALMRSRIAVRS